MVFGMAVTILREDETEATFRIVGKDEADPSTGRIAWTAPVAHALLGSRPGTFGNCRQARSRSVHQWDARSTRVALGDTTFTESLARCSSRSGAIARPNRSRNSA